ncbi:hypothetical protein BgiBS90_035653 [Biomphalaria glabrata]|nr:hypothetical protein BgiBS90_035653 [Biomphalaria glabrata]
MIKLPIRANEQPELACPSIDYLKLTNGHRKEDDMIKDAEDNLRSHHDNRATLDMKERKKAFKVLLITD